MGSLYLAMRPETQAIDGDQAKNSNHNRELRERFAREAESVARLRHPNIVVIFDVGEDDSSPDL